MKKLIALLLTFVMLLSLAACGKDDTPKDDDEGKKKETTSQGGDKDDDNTQSGDDDKKDPVISDEITVENLMNYPESPEEDFFCEDLGDGVWMLSQYLGDDEIVVIPETVNGKNVEVIGSHVFGVGSSVKAVKLPDSVYKLDGCVFGHNENLEVVVFGDGMREIDRIVEPQCPFMNCINLREVVLNDGLELIGGLAFGMCNSLMSIEIPASVTEIGNAAFYAAPEGFTIIGEAGSYAEQYANENGINFQVK